jgi:hypothetical protein
MPQALALVAAASFCAQRNAPILCMDTCSLLDVLRGPLRPGGARTVSAATELLLAEAVGRLTIFMTTSMLPEFARNEANVRKELTRHLQKIDDNVLEAANCLQHFGSITPNISFANSSLAVDLDAKYKALFGVCNVVDDDDDAKTRAMNRVISQLRPSQKGSALDANIIEHYLGLGAALRAVGVHQPFVFVSSNTNDYCEAGVLHQDLTGDFKALGLEYTSTLPWAKTALGI